MSLVRKIGDDIRRGKTTAQDITKAYIDKVGRKNRFKAPFYVFSCVRTRQIQATDEVVGSFTSVSAEQAMSQVLPFFVIVGGYPQFCFFVTS